MSSGYNGIPIRSVGRTRERLACLLNDSLGLTGTQYEIQAEDLCRTNPFHRHFEDCCAWDCYTTEPLRRHVFSWATMTHCVRHGISPDFSNLTDIEV